MNQKLVTKKNRKVRRLRELYPGVRCKIFYQRDYVSLLVKYGLESPSAIGPAAPAGTAVGLDLTSAEDDLPDAAPPSAPPAPGPANGHRTGAEIRPGRPRPS